MYLYLYSMAINFAVIVLKSLGKSSLKIRLILIFDRMVEDHIRLNNNFEWVYKYENSTGPYHKARSATSTNSIK